MNEEDDLLSDESIRTGLLELEDQKIEYTFPSVVAKKN